MLKAIKRYLNQKAYNNKTYDFNKVDKVLRVNRHLAILLLNFYTILPTALYKWCVSINHDYLIQLHN